MEHSNGKILYKWSILMGKSSINGSLWLGKSTNHKWRICHLAMFDYQTMSYSHNPRSKPTKIFKCLGGFYQAQEILWRVVRRYDAVRECYDVILCHDVMMIS